MATGQGRGISNQGADPHWGGTGGAAAGSPGSAKPSPSPWPSVPPLPNPFDDLIDAFKAGTAEEARKAREAAETIAWTVVIGGGVAIGAFLLVNALSAGAFAYGSKKAYDSGLLGEAWKAIGKGAKYL